MSSSQILTDQDSQKYIWPEHRFLIRLHFDQVVEVGSQFGYGNAIMVCFPAANRILQTLKT